MSEQLQNEVSDLLMQAQTMGHTPAAVAKAEDAVRLADSHHDIDLGFEARQALMDIAAYSGDNDKMVVAFSWCLAQADKQRAETGEDTRESQLLWKYKWVIEKLIHFPRVSRAQIEAALADFQSRCQRASYNKRPTLFLRFMCELKMGNPKEAARMLPQWQEVGRDSMSDCRACELHHMVEYHAMIDDHHKAIEVAQPILQGRLGCAEIPHLTYATLLRSFWAVGQTEEAAHAHQRGYRLVRGTRDCLPEQANHVMHLLRGGQTDRALTLVRRHLIWALESRNQDHQFYFLLATRAAVRRLTEEGFKSMRLRLPEGTLPEARKTTVPLAPLTSWLDQKIYRLAGDFDRRNGNQWFTSMAGTVEPSL